MWNILIVIIIAIIIWAFNPLAHVDLKSPNGVDKKTMDNVNQVENQAIQQVNKARQAQQQELQNLNNN